MNSGTRAAVAYCLARGHTPIAIHNGFPGLVRHHADKPLGAVREMDWLEVEGWISRGGSEIGTNRELPSKAGMGETADCFNLYNFDALFIIGGFEAFTALSELRKARPDYPAFRIPMMLLPATISNNVPGTEYSVGSDTCLNALINYVRNPQLSIWHVDSLTRPSVRCNQTISICLTPTHLRCRNPRGSLRIYSHHGRPGE